MAVKRAELPFMEKLLTVNKVKHEVTVYAPINIPPGNPPPGI